MENVCSPFFHESFSGTRASWLDRRPQIQRQNINRPFVTVYRRRLVEISWFVHENLITARFFFEYELRVGLFIILMLMFIWWMCRMMYDSCLRQTHPWKIAVQLVKGRPAKASLDSNYKEACIL